MSRTRLGAGAAALVLALGAAGPLAGCGDDEGDVETTITTDPTGEPEIIPEDPGGPPEEPDTDAGGTEAPLVPDEGHEGGGPDPGTEEFEQAPGASGGSSPGTSEDASSGEQPVDQPGAGNDDVGSGGASPPESFDQFCEENPRSCE